MRTTVGYWVVVHRSWTTPGRLQYMTRLPELGEAGWSWEKSEAMRFRTKREALAADIGLAAHVVEPVAVEGGVS